MNLKGAIFDLDGTLIDSMHLWDNLGVSYLTYKGCSIAEDINTLVKQMTLVQVAEYFRDAYGVEGTVEEIIDDIIGTAREFYRDAVPLKSGVRRFLDYLQDRNVKMCIATAAERYLAESALLRLGVLDHFSGIVTCTEVGQGKNNPVIYIKALEILGTDIEETAVFEDALYAIETAKSAGFYVVGVHDKSAENDKDTIIERADLYLRSYEEWEY